MFKHLTTVVLGLALLVCPMEMSAQKAAKQAIKPITTTDPTRPAGQKDVIG